MVSNSLFQPKPWLDLFQSYGRSFYTPPRPAKPLSSTAPSSEANENEATEHAETSPTITIFILPSEVLHLILSLLDPEQFSTLAQVSTQFLPFVYDPRHWRRIAHKLWPNESLSQLEHRLHDYKSWRKLCILRPRLRTNVIFTVRHQYAKTTDQSAMTMNEPEAPVFLISYYRFLRFYTDGTVVSLTTPEHPHLALHRIRRSWRPNGLEKDKTYPCVGTYAFDEGARRVVLELPMNNPKFPDMRSGTVYMHLVLSGTKEGAYDRLVVTEHYTIMDHEGGEVVPYRVEGNKPYKLVPVWGFKTAVYKHFPKDDHKDLAQWFEMKKAARASRHRSSITS